MIVCKIFFWWIIFDTFLQKRDLAQKKADMFHPSYHVLILRCTMTTLTRSEAPTWTWGPALGIRFHPESSDIQRWIRCPKNHTWQSFRSSTYRKQSSIKQQFWNTSIISIFKNSVKSVKFTINVSGPPPSIRAATDGSTGYEEVSRGCRPRHDGAAQLWWGLQWTETPDTLTSSRPVRGPWRVRKKDNFLRSTWSKYCQQIFRSYPPGAGRGKSNGPPTPHNGKKTKGRVSKLHLFSCFVVKWQ